jgi:hypothetical protein
MPGMPGVRKIIAGRSAFSEAAAGRHEKPGG